MRELFLLAAGCTRDVSRTRVLPPKQRSTSTVVDLPVATAHGRAVRALEDSAAGRTVFPLSTRSQAGNYDFADHFAVEEQSDPGFGAKILAESGNQHDLYVHTFHQALWPSPVYRGKRGGLPFLAAFHVHMVAQGPQRTLVTIRALDTEVMNGQKWMLGSCGPG